MQGWDVIVNHGICFIHCWNKFNYSSVVSFNIFWNLLIHIVLTAFLFIMVVWCFLIGFRLSWLVSFGLIHHVSFIILKEHATSIFRVTELGLGGCWSDWEEEMSWYINCPAGRRIQVFRVFSRDFEHLSLLTCDAELVLPSILKDHQINVSQCPFKTLGRNEFSVTCQKTWMFRVSAV